MKDEFKRQMEIARKRVFDELPAEKRRDTFANFYTDAVLWAEALADAEGLGDKCRERGLDRLLKVRAVQFTVGAMKSLVYSQVVGEQWQPRHPHRGDGYDLWHAELASVADVFVTGDERLGKQLERVPLDDFRLVKGSLNDLLAVLGRGA
jgi:hypothetical protein